MLSLGFLFFLWFVNGLFLQYERTAIQAALLDGARQGARTTPFDADTCKETAAVALRSTARGVLADGQVGEVTCTLDTPSASRPGGSVTVTVTARIKLKTVFPAPAAIAPVKADDTLTATVQRRSPGAPG